MNDILPENNYNPAMAENLKLVEVNPDTIPPLTIENQSYNRYATFAYNINTTTNNNSINPTALYNPAFAEDLKFVEIDSSVIPPLSGNFGIYPRYAQLVYLLNPSSGGGTSSGVNTINGISGDVNIINGGGIDINTDGNNITLSTSPAHLNFYTEDVDNNSSNLLADTINLSGENINLSGDTFINGINLNNQLTSINSQLDDINPTLVSTNITSTTDIVYLNLNNNTTSIPINDNSLQHIIFTIYACSNNFESVLLKNISVIVTRINGNINYSNADVTNINSIGNENYNITLDCEIENDSLVLKCSSSDISTIYTFYKMKSFNLA